MYIHPDKHEILLRIPTEALPEGIYRCGMCEGKGSYEQTYTAGCGRGYYSMIGSCDWCESIGFRDSIRNASLTESQVAQLLTLGAQYLPEG